MKLASYKDGSRDGQLVVVSRDLKTAHYASGIATRLQQVLDDWNFMSPQLEHVYDMLNQGKLRHAFPFDAAQCMAPLPRPAQWIVTAATAPEETSAGPMELALASAPPALLRAASDEFLGPHDDIVLAASSRDIEFEGLIAAITGDVPRGASADTGLDAVRLLTLATDITLAAVARHERERGMPPFQSRPATAFAPVAVTSDELGAAWKGGRVHLPLHSRLNGRIVRRQDTAAAMRFDFGALIAAAAAQRNVRAGSIVGCGLDGPAGAPTSFGDVVRIGIDSQDGPPMFGWLENTVAAAR